MSLHPAAVFAAVVALTASGGALGLVVGLLGPPDEVAARLPLGGPALCGIALALVLVSIGRHGLRARA